MNFTKRLRFFGIGLLLGTALSLILFGPEKFSCSGYLPEGRVLAELQTKKWENDSIISKELSSYGFVSNELVRDSLLPHASIDFNESEPRLEPCGQYSLYFPKDNAHLQLSVYKCDSTAYISSIKPL